MNENKIVITFKGIDKLISELKVKMVNLTFESKNRMLLCGKILQNNDLNGNEQEFKKKCNGS